MAKSGVPAAIVAPNKAGRIGACDPSAKSQTVTFVHVNDLHANYAPDSAGQSPFARIRGFYEQVRRETPHVVFTNGGDDYEKGSVAELLSRGAATREAVHAMRFDVRVLGNHDFAWGADELARDAADPHARVLLSNVRREGQPFPAKEYTELEVGCVKIGFFGLVSDPLNEHDKSYPGDHLPGFQTDHEFGKRARALVEAHRGEVQLVVMVSHLGKEMDKEVAGAVPGIDVVLGAHSHDAFDKVDIVEGRTAVIQAGHGASHIARLALEYDFAGRRVSKIDYTLVENKPGLPVDGEVQAAVDKLLARHAPDHGRQIATLMEKTSKADGALIAGRAAIVKLRTDGAIVNDTVIAETIGKGALSQQGIVTVYPVQRQPPNTPGFTSFYTVEVDAAGLALLQKSLPKDFRYVGPKLDPGRRSYRLAVPKLLAVSPNDVPGKVALGNPAFGCEAWEAVEAYGKTRTAACLHLDQDTPLPGCTKAGL